MTIEEGCIIANRHIHMSPADGEAFGLKDGDTVTVETDGARRTRFYDVQIRVSPQFRLEMHIDTDDANAAGIGQRGPGEGLAGHEIRSNAPRGGGKAEVLLC